MDKDGVPIAIECIIFQLGAERVISAGTTLCHTVQGQLAETTKVSNQIPDRGGNDHLTKNVKANFAKTARIVLTDKLLYNDTQPFHTQTIDNR